MVALKFYMVEGRDAAIYGTSLVGSCEILQGTIIIENELLTTVITCHAQRGKLFSSPAEGKQRYHAKNTSFLIHRLIIDWTRVDTSGADR